MPQTPPSNLAPPSFLRAFPQLYYTHLNAS
jgi:hypothetical protein